MIAGVSVSNFKRAMLTRLKSWTTTKVDQHGSRRTPRPPIETRTDSPQAQRQPVVARHRRAFGSRDGHSQRPPVDYGRHRRAPRTLFRQWRAVLAGFARPV